MMSYLKDVATKLCDFYDITCCSGQKNKHFGFYCENNVDPAIVTNLKGGYHEYGIEQGNQYATFVGAYELFSFINEKPEICAMASKVMKTIFYLVNFCLENFHNNYCIDQFVKNLFAGKESTNILQEEEEEIKCQNEDVDEVKQKIKKIWSHLSLGMCRSLHFHHQHMIIILKLKTPLLCMILLL
jgi:hypothetical protein